MSIVSKIVKVKCNGLNQYYWYLNINNITKELLKQNFKTFLYIPVYFFFIIVGCMPGYTGVNCTSSCPYPYYGEDCQKTCNCGMNLCDVSIGCIGLTKGN